MAKQTKKPQKLRTVQDKEYAVFLRGVVENKREFREALVLEMPQKKVGDIKKLLDSYVAVFHRKGIPIKTLDERYRLVGGEIKECILMLEPLTPIRIDQRIVNRHYVVIKQEVRAGEPYVIVTFYLNTQSDAEIKKMDAVLSILASHLMTKGFKLIDERLVRFNPEER